MCTAADEDEAQSSRQHVPALHQHTCMNSGPGPRNMIYYIISKLRYIISTRIYYIISKLSMYKRHPGVGAYQVSSSICDQQAGQLTLEGS